jgi:hypothetical protein
MRVEKLLISQCGGRARARSRVTRILNLEAKMGGVNQESIQAIDAPGASGLKYFVANSHIPWSWLA